MPDVFTGTATPSLEASAAEAGVTRGPKRAVQLSGNLYIEAMF